MKQPALPLAYRSATGFENFAMTPANELAVSYLDRWPDWPSHMLLLAGPPGSGKSHLGAMFAARTGGRVLRPGQMHSRLKAPTLVVDALPPFGDPGLDEEGLFHLINWTREQGIGLLLLCESGTGPGVPALPDLASRLRAAPRVEIGQPDDALVGALLVKQFRDRGVDVPPEVVDYLMVRLPRDFAQIAATVARLDAAGLEQRRALTIPFVRQVLNEVS